LKLSARKCDWEEFDNGFFAIQKARMAPSWDVDADRKYACSVSRAFWLAQMFNWAEQTLIEFLILLMLSEFEFEFFQLSSTKPLGTMGIGFWFRQFLFFAIVFYLFLAPPTVYTEFLPMHIKQTTRRIKWCAQLNSSCSLERVISNLILVFEFDRKFLISTEIILCYFTELWCFSSNYSTWITLLMMTFIISRHNIVLKPRLKQIENSVFRELLHELSF
jgi:hypothetical protein